MDQDSGDSNSPTPAQLLSVARQASGPATAAPAAPEPQKERKPGRQWAVQVAAFADRKDAEAMASELRQNGQAVFVMTAQAEGKTWHRVRVGEFSDLGSAKRLRESLSNQAQFKHAYVTPINAE
jgi:cell division septation protein DedD